MKKKLLTTALALTMGLSLVACGGAKKADEKTKNTKTSEKTVEKTTTIRKDSDDQPEVDTTSNTPQSTTQAKGAANEDYLAILNVVGYPDKQTGFTKEGKTLTSTAFAKLISGGIEVIELGADKGVVYEIVDKAIYPLDGLSEEDMQQVNANYQSIPGQYAAYGWIEVTCYLENNCEVVQFRYRDLDNAEYVAALPQFGHMGDNSLENVSNGLENGGFTKR